MVFRQFHHRFVQFFFQINQPGLLFCVARSTCVDKLAAILQVEVLVVHAQIVPVLVPFDEVDRQIEPDPVEPGEKFGIEPERVDALVGLLEGLHRQVPGIGLVVGHVVEHPQQPRLIAAHQLVKCGRITRLGALHQHTVGDFLTLRLGGFGRFHAPPLRLHLIQRKRSGKRRCHGFSP